jgi:N-acetylglucosaminyldiphosphoundecaprenol N-acetyl-beta-D-mannosaminyltransferase
MKTSLKNRRREKLFNIEIDRFSRDELLTDFSSGALVTPNVDHLMLLQENPSLLEAYRAAEYVVVDSQIVFWALQFLGRAVPEKISGSDFLPAYCDYHAKHTDNSLFILGGRPGVPEAAMRNINARVGKRLVVGAHSPSMSFARDEAENSAVVEMINHSRAHCLIVGLGCPKQEIWIHRNRAHLTHVSSFLAVGAAVDFEAGSVPRAPAWMAGSGLEWAFRLFREPRRMAKRYLVRDPKFFWMILKCKMLGT